MMTSPPSLVLVPPVILFFLLLLLPAGSSSSSPPDDAAEQAFLGILGLPAKPTARPPAVIPQRLKDLYEELNHLEPGTFDREQRLGKHHHRHHKQHKRSLPSSSVHLPGNTVRTFYFQDDHEEEDAKRDAHSRHFVFDVAALPSTETLHRAELHVLRDAPRNANTSSSASTLRLSAYQVLSARDKHEMMVDTKLIRHKPGEKWHTLDVTDAVKQWQSAPGTNHGIRVEVLGDRDGHTRLRRSAATVADEDWHAQQPLVMAFTDDRDIETQRLEQEKHSHRHDRRRRSEQARTRRSKKNKRRRRKRICRRHSLLVDFEEVGWNSWIVAPPSFDAYYCHGECPFALSDNLNTTNHAVVQSLVHSMNPEAVPKPCCVPTELSPFSLLYVNTNGTLVLKAYKDMVVEACGCR